MGFSTWVRGVVATAVSNQAKATSGGAPGAAQPVPAATLPDREAAFTAPFEGFRGSPYTDVAGVWTIGYGSIRDGNANRVTQSTQAITEAEARTLLARDLTGADHTVSAEVRVPLTEDQRVALTDFVYNLGCGAFAGSSLLKKLNAGDMAGAAAEFDKLDHAGGKECAGLLRRREAERKAFV